MLNDMIKHRFGRPAVPLWRPMAIIAKARIGDATAPPLNLHEQVYDRDTASFRKL